jgi:pimeloyl-ACP methyl ester carboxylesterase
MSATLPMPAPPLTRRGGGRRDRLARLELPLLAAGLVLVTLHLLDLALSGPDTSVLGVLDILAVPAAWLIAQRHVTRPTRLALGVAFGLLAFGFGVVSHGLHVVNGAGDLYDVTGLAFILGGLLLAASGLAATMAARRTPRHAGIGFRAAHGVGWLAGAAIVFLLGFMPLVMGFMLTHAPRWPIEESALAIPHQDVRIATTDGRKLAAWYVPSTNRAAVLVSHGSGGSRKRVAAHIRMLARHGYGVLALDNPGNGDSQGHSNGLGDNAQPGIDAALDYLTRRPDVDRGRIAGLGLSLGGEVLLEATGRDQRLRAVISDGAARPADSRKVDEAQLAERVLGALGMQAVRGISGMRAAPSLFKSMPAIAPRPALLIASGADPTEIPTNEAYRDTGGANVALWTLPESGHTAGLRTRPAEYERRVIAFLDAALVGADEVGGAHEPR